MKKGFTIIEFLTVMSIIVILSLIFFLGHQGEEEKMALQRGCLKLVQDLREVQEMTMAAEQQDCDGSFSYSFGIYFTESSPDQYIIFADCNGNYRKDSSDVVVREIKIEKLITIFDLSRSPLNIVFYPPEPLTFINSKSQGNEGIITFSLKSSPSEQKKVKINTAGKIEIE